MSVCAVEHLTVYRYTQPVFLQPQTLRLRPRTNSVQRLLNFNVRIVPDPTGFTECLDQDGNQSLYVWFDQPTDEFSVRTTFRVELLHDNPFDFLMSPESLELPMRYPAPLDTALLPYRKGAEVPAAVRDFAHTVAGAGMKNSLLFLIVLNQRIYQSFEHITRPYGNPMGSGETLRLMSGSCRDLAMLFCDACRSMGFASRFVSGYEYASATAAVPYMHAWAEVYLPDVGWRGYDPSRGIAVSSAHIAVAAAFDPQLAAPVAGLFTGYGAGSNMQASLTLHVERDLIT